MNPLILLTQKLSNASRERIGDISPIRLNSNDVIVCMRQGRQFIGYQYVASTATWRHHWSEPVFGQQGNYPLDRYPWLVADKLLNDGKKDVIILQHPDGVRFYQPDISNAGLKLLKEDTHFHEVYGHTLLWGRFYPDTDEIGVMARSHGDGVGFYVIGRDSLWANTTYPLFPLGSDWSVTPAWSAADTELFITKLRHNDPATIGLRTTHGLEFYQFNADYLLEKVIGTAQITKATLGNSAQDHLFFGDLTHQIYQDILHLNNSGLFVYQYNNSQKDYRCLHRHTEFTQPYGWLPHYKDSIRLTDLNGDRRDDLLFTGPEGITALSFDATTNSWQTLLDPNQLSGAQQRYATVVGVLPPLPPTLSHPSLFMQDAAGKVQWAKVMPAPTTTTTVRTTTTTSTHTTTRPSSHRDALVPEQITRTNLLEKPPLRWAEQWDDRFLKETVDPASGQVFLNIPLVDLFASTGWKFQLALSYNSQVGRSDLLGVGWSLPLAQDYIFVDHQGSIYPEDAHYYLMAEGRPQRLKFIANEGGVQRFQLAKEAEGVQITVAYHPSAERWMIEGTAEQTTYGKASRSAAQDALQWSLGWPNWRGMGRDKAEQQPLITAWYLNMRLDKDNQRTLYYHYEKDSATIAGGTTYDAALRLKTISNGKDMELHFAYASKKSSDEYTPPNPVDQEGNIIFPIPLAQSHYLEEYKITTATYSQALQFAYQVKDGKRLLTAIQQQLLAHTEPVLQFRYQSVLDKPALQSCTLLPKGSTVRFNYQTLSPPAPTVSHSYPTREKAKMAYGPDYAVMAYRDLNPTAGKVILRIMNRAMTQTSIDCSVDTALTCPSAESEIKDYVVQAYPDSFVVFIESDQKRTLFIFDRQEQTWSIEPTIHRFGKQALIRFSETVIAAAEPDEKTIMLFKRGDNQADWKQQTLTLPRAIAALALHNRLIVGYDDHQLWLFRHDVQSGWKKQCLDNESNNINRIIGLFDLETETREQIATALNHRNNLQMLNNLILLNTLEENNGLLSSHTHLFLLDAQYNIAKKQSFKIERKNFYQISHESKSKDGNIVYHLGYLKEGGLFKVRVKDVSGKTIEDIRNRNRKADRIEEIKKQTNQNSDFQTTARQYVLLDLNVHIAAQFTAQISQQGVYVGNDTLLRITGTGWESEPLKPTAQSTNLLGKYFVLASNDHKTLFELYKQGSNQKKQGKSLKTLQLHEPGQVINRYPAYIAYHPAPNQVQVLTFKDGQTLGRSHTFYNEQLLSGSDFQNLITAANASSTTRVHAEPQEYRVRAVSTLLPPKEQSFVNQMTLTAGDTQRISAYERSFKADQEGLTYAETVTIIPGNNKTAYGWHEATRAYQRGKVIKTEQWFDANGKQIVGPPEEKSPGQATNTTTAASTPNPMLLLDRSGKWLVSDFSPYSLADEMVAYYGFEPYEKNQIGVPVANTTAKAWRTSQAPIVKGNFPFTGEHYLQLKSTTAQSSFLEGLFQPRDQETTYLAACWIRCSTAPTLDTAISHLRAVIHTSNGQKIIGLKAQTKQQVGDWSYLELPLNFQVLRQVYRDYIAYHATTSSNHTLPSPEDATFQITLRVEAPADQIVDLDHIRFAPITHDFQAAVYHPFIGKPTAIIQANGLVTRTIYNHLQQEISSTDEEGQLQEFTSTSRTGKLVPAPQGSTIDAKPNVITFEPAYGSYEIFDTTAWRNRWKLDHTAAWEVAPGQLWHKPSGKHRIEARADVFDGTRAAIRCYFALQEPRAALALHWQGIGSVTFTRQSDHSTKVALPNGESIAALPSAGELIVMVEQNYLWLWVDGVLLVDQALPIARPSTDSPFTPWSSFVLEAQGKVLVEDCLIMNRPQVTVKHYNAFGEKTQVIQLEDAQTAQVNEVLYDALGREAITTKTTRVKRNAGQSLLTYRPDFVGNKNPAHPQSVWHTGILEGEVNRLNPADQGIAYKRTEYAPNPLDQEKSLGLPGPDFSITGRYATKISQHSGLAFLDNLFPTHQGYRQKVEHTPNGSLHIAVFDQGNNQVAKYVRVPSYNHLLSTYEYDTENRLIKILPPLYHEKVNTASRLTAWQFGEDRLSSEEKQWQQALAARFTYDRYGRLVRKFTPDSGTTEYLYNAAGQQRFMVSIDATNQPQKIVYFNYDGNNQLMSTGHINRPLSLTALRQHLESAYLPYAKAYQQFDYADGHFDPLLRGRMKQYITHNDGEVVIEKLRFDAQQQVMSKWVEKLRFDPQQQLIPPKAVVAQAESDLLTNVEKQYVYGKLQQLIYPITLDGKPLHLVHSYNRLGQLVGLGTANNPTHYAGFTYHATGQLASEQYQPHTVHRFTRSYRYNSPGFLERISDPFLTEDIAYTNKGYGQAGYGDGMVMQATFNASWPVNADGRWFQIQENDLGGNYSAVCIKALKRTGYLDNNGQPIKLYVREAETALPLVCGGETGRHMAKLVTTKQKPTYYGHRYAYGNHQELVKAKYFIDDTESLSNPLQPDSFAKAIPGLSKQQSQHIWELLTKAGYIIADQQRNDPATAVGKRGGTFFRNTDLRNDLSALNDRYTLYVEPIERFIVSAIGRQSTVSLADFEATFLHWQGLDLTSSRLIYTWQQGIAKQIGQMLLNKGYLPTQATGFTRPLNSNFTATLKPYKGFIPKIVQTLSQHFAHGLGATAFDVASYKIDANGNHHLFYTGFNRYELAYRNATNQIESVKLDWPIALNALEGEKVFAMKHDAQGNVVQALHKNIQHIEYHPVSQRTTRIQLTDNRTLHFYYDAQGERVLKQVFDAEGTISHETHYLRDEQGKVLMDRQTNYVDGSTQKIVTAYLYGPRGLLGFIRNNNFYSVATDHAGSVRLVIKDGSVVAAYDYLPYGGLMRSYGNDPQAHIVYRYTGQEWDEETGLYNYHARLYDPSLGRFYQIDPKAQYFSPYKYAGNSPISIVDPDGELAFLLTCIVLGIVGAYLGGAAANNRWNPVDWDFKDGGTWLGIVGGGIAGGLAPLGAVASVGAIGVIGTVALGVGVGYLSTAAASGNWDPSQWNWDRPDTWSALFQGGAAGAGIAGGVAIAHSFANGGKAIQFLSNLKALNAIGIGQRAVKGIFLTVSYTAGGSVAYLRAGAANNNFAFWEWDWTNPATFSGLVDGFDTGMGWPQNIMEMGRGVGKFIKNPTKVLFSGQKSLKLKAILKNPKHPLYRTTTSVVMAYYMGSAANGDFDVTKWNLAVFSTYEGVLNGVFFGKDITKTLKYIRDAKVKQPSHALEHVPKNKANHWSRGVSRLLESIQTSRSRIGEKFQHLMVQAFAEGTTRLLSKLSDQSPAIRSQVDSFLQGGVKKWQSGENPPPKEVQRLIAEEAKLKVQEDSALNQWKAESEEALRKQQEVFPDEEDRAFLNCGGRARRRKRMAGSGSCSIPTDIDNEQPKNTDPELITNFIKPELIQQLLKKDDPGIKTNEAGYQAIQPSDQDFKSSSPQGFAQHFSLLLNKTPNILGPTKPDFFLNLILGSILTQHAVRDSSDIAKAVYAKFETVQIPNGAQLVEHKILKVCFKEGDTLVLRTFFAENKGETADTLYLHNFKQRLDDARKYSPAELDEINKKLGNGDYKHIQENVFYIDANHALSVKSSLKMQSDAYLNAYTEQMKEFLEKLKNENLFQPYLKHFGINLIAKTRSNTNSKIELFPSGDAIIQIAQEKVKKINDANIIKPNVDANNNPIPRNNELNEALHEISSDKIEDVQKGIKAFSEGLLEIWHKHAATFGFNINSESGFHGFLYGALSLNFKYSHNLDVYVERIAGRGYADLILLSRNGPDGNKKNWRAIPIIIELKADGTSSSNANDQITGTGYLYNLSMRTVAKEAVVVGINSNTQVGVTVAKGSIPESKGFIQQLIANVEQGDDIQRALTTELKHLYYSISPLAIKKTDNHYLSRLILGELLSRQKEIHVRSDRALSTFVFEEKGTWVMLNLVESSKAIPKQKNGYEFEDVDINAKAKLPNLGDDKRIDNLLRIDIKVNPNSKGGWSYSEPKRKDSQDSNEGQYYFQNIEVKSIDVSNPAPPNEQISYSTLKSNVDVKKFFPSEADIQAEKPTQGQSIDQEKINIRKKVIEDQLKKLSESLKPLQDIIKSESDFQAVLQGLFLGLAKQVDQGTIIKVFPEANLSKEGRSDLIISMLKERENQPIHEEGIILMELKYTSESSNRAFQELDNGIKQIEQYGPHLKPITDLGVVTPIVAVFYPEGIRFEILDSHTIDHTSGKIVRSLSRVVSTANQQPVDSQSQFATPLKGKRPANSKYTDYPGNKKSKAEENQGSQDGRRKRSLGYVEDHGNKTTIHSQTESKLVVDNALTYVPSTTQVIAPYKRNVEEVNPLNNNLAVASSGSNKLQFWPVSMVKKAGQAIVSILSINWLSSSKEKGIEDPPVRNVLQPEPLTQQPVVKSTAVSDTLLEAQVAPSAHQQLPFNTSTTGPTLLEMGDQWVKNTDTNGLLTWGILLARKWTGYRPKAFQVPSHDPATAIALSIRSHEWVDAFMDQVGEQAQACGMEEATSAIFENAEWYTQAIETVRKKMATGQVDGIAAPLFEQVVQQNSSKIAKTTTSDQADQWL
ncbi:MAG TPA: RHS repeat-associated core domain-containing protein, partial [Amoebophilaceae bacterium]|nr:RHS repeat-associated core domain-containing protein [Amoebophilaceae bacterium]